MSIHNICFCGEGNKKQLMVLVKKAADDTHTLVFRPS